MCKNFFFNNGWVNKKKIKPLVRYSKIYSTDNIELDFIGLQEAIKFFTKSSLLSNTILKSIFYA